MKLKATKFPYSSIVGGGIMLHDETGAARFIVGIRGTTQGVTKEETAAISDAIIAGLPAGGFEVPDRAKEPS